VKDAKVVFARAAAQSETMIVERILVRVLPDLLRHGQTLNAEMIEGAAQVLVPDELYAQILRVAETLTGRQLIQDGEDSHV
jgi:hypothetical protein